MAYFWTAETAPGTSLDPEDLDHGGLDVRFDTQQEAEAWLGATYADLLDRGVTQVSLFEEQRLVYGPMPLTE